MIDIVIFSIFDRCETKDKRLRLLSYMTEDINPRWANSLCVTAPFVWLNLTMIPIIEIVGYDFSISYLVS